MTPFTAGYVRPIECRNLLISHEDIDWPDFRKHTPYPKTINIRKKMNNFEADQIWAGRAIKLLKCTNLMAAGFKTMERYSMIVFPEHIVAHYAIVKDSQWVVRSKYYRTRKDPVRDDSSREDHVEVSKQENKIFPEKL